MAVLFVSASSNDDSAITFFRIVTVAWRYLRPRDARSIRAACRDGRLLHDSLTACVDLHLGRRGPGAAEPHPTDLARALGAAADRGMRARDISLSMGELREGDDPSVREQQILTVLSSKPVTTLDSLHLSGHPHLTPAIASAAAARAPARLFVSYDQPPPPLLLLLDNLLAAGGADLDMDFPGDAHQGAAGGAADAAGDPILPLLPLSRDANTYAALELLTGCLPGLTELGLQGVAHWPAVVLHCLHLGSRLTSLSLELNDAMSLGLDGHHHHHDQLVLSNTDLQSCLHAVSRLPHLTSLHLESASSATTANNSNGLALRGAAHRAAVCRHFPSRPDACRLDARCLAGLTRLSRLSLDLELLHQEEATWGLARQPPELAQRWLAVWDRQRAGLAAAMRSMPALTDLRLIGVQLSVSDLGAMSALECLTVRGLLSPPQATGAAAVDPRVASATAAAAAGPRWPLPPRLRELRVLQASPTVLGSLIAPASLTDVGMFGPSRIDFTPLDLHTPTVGAGAEVEDGADGAGLPRHGGRQRGPRLSLAAVGAFRSTVQLLQGRLLRARVAADASLCVTAEGAREALRPPPLPQAPPAAAAVVVHGSGPEGVSAVPACPAPAASGHAAWLSALSALELRALRLEHILLDREDVAYIGNCLGSLKELDLSCCAFPPESLASLAALKHMGALTFTWGAGGAEYDSWGVAEVVETALLRLAAEAPSLVAVCVQPPQQAQHAGACRPVLEAVQAALAARGSRVRVGLEW